jgi:hypothetical protein
LRLIEHRQKRQKNSRSSTLWFQRRWMLKKCTFSQNSQNVNCTSRKKRQKNVKNVKTSQSTTLGSQKMKKMTVFGTWIFVFGTRPVSQVSFSPQFFRGYGSCLLKDIR